MPYRSVLITFSKYSLSIIAFPSPLERRQRQCRLFIQSLFSSVSVSLRNNAPEPAHFTLTSKMPALVIHDRAGIVEIVNFLLPPAATPFYNRFKFKFQGLPPLVPRGHPEGFCRIFQGSRRCPDIAESIPSGES